KEGKVRHHWALRGSVGGLHGVYARPARGRKPGGAPVPGARRRTGNRRALPLYRRYRGGRAGDSISPRYQAEGAEPGADDVPGRGALWRAGSVPRSVHLRPTGRTGSARMRQGPGTKPIETSGGMTCGASWFSIAIIAWLAAVVSWPARWRIPKAGCWNPPSPRSFHPDGA